MRLILFLLTAVSLQAQFRAGAAKTLITPDLAKFSPVYLAGFGQNRVATGVHDDLYARCIAMQKESRPLVVCTVDLIGLFLDDTERIRAALPGNDLIVASTHVHEGPDTMGQWGPAQGQSGLNEAYNTFVVEQVTAAAKQSIAALKPATAKLAVVKSPELDGFISDTRPPVRHDSDLIVLSLTGEDGQSIATAVNWANHPETLGSKNTLITADYPGYLYKHLEKRLGGVAALWNGAIGGMQSPLGAMEVSFEGAEKIGRRVAELAADAVEKAAPSTFDRITVAESDVHLPLANKGFEQAFALNLFRGRKRLSETGTSVTRVGAIRLSPLLEIALVPGELYPELSVGGTELYPGADYPDAPLEPSIKSLMKAQYRMLIGLANDEIGYIIPKREWDEKPPYLQNAAKRWYGEVNSVGPDTAPLLITAMQRLFGRRWSTIERAEPSHLRAVHEARLAFSKARKTPPRSGPFKEYRAILHVHAEDAQHTLGKRADVLAAAKKTGVQVVMFTDHRGPLPETWSGVRDGVLFIAGAELSNELAYPSMKLRFRSHLEETPHASSDEYQGAEIYNRHADSEDEPVFHRHLQRVAKDETAWAAFAEAAKAYPDEIFGVEADYPGDYFAWFDRETQKRRLTAIGANDAHQNTIMRGLTLDPYEVSFRNLSTHILAQDLTAPEIEAALRQGRAFVAHDWLCDSEGFSFTRDAKTIKVVAPLKATLKVLRNGVVVQQAIAKKLDFDVKQPGVYRAEAWLTVDGEDRPWIYSNPLYFEKN